MFRNVIIYDYRLSSPVYFDIPFALNKGFSENGFIPLLLHRGRLNQKILEHHKPEYLVTTWDDLSKKLDLLREYKRNAEVKIICHTTTVNGITPRPYINREIIRNKDVIDAVYSSGLQKEIMEAYKEEGIKYFLLQGNMPLNTDIFKPLNTVKKYDIIYFGQYWHKSEIIEKFIIDLLRDRYISSLIIGRDWPYMGQGKNIKYINDIVLPSQANVLVNQSRVCPVTHWEGQPELNPRIINFTGAKAMVVSDNQKLVNGFFPMLPCSDDPKEFHRLVFHYLNNPGTSIIEDNYQRVKKNYTAEKFVENILIAFTDKD